MTAPRGLTVILFAALLSAMLLGSAVRVVPVAETTGSPPRCTIKGTEGPDVLVGTGGDDVICGRGGDDKLVGGGGADELRGGSGDDELRGGPGDDLLRGESGRDAVTGGTGRDFLRGGRNADKMDSRDRVGFHDLVRCGPGPGDEAFADPKDDVVAGCEEINQNDPPTAIILTPSVVLEGAAAGTVVGSLAAVDPDLNDQHTFELVGGAGSEDNGSFTVQGAWLRTAAVFDFESDKTLSVRVRATDAAGESGTEMLRIDVTDVQEGTTPVAVDDAVTVSEDSGWVTVDVLHNDTSAVGVPMTLGDHDPASAHGAISETTGGTALAYRPGADYCGPDSFTYRLLPGGAKATVRVTVTCVDDAPVATPDLVTVPFGAFDNALQVLANDLDRDGGPMTVVDLTQPSDGSTSVAPDGAGLIYRPRADFCNLNAQWPDTFTYTLNGGSTATVEVRIPCDEKIPVAIDDSVDIVEDSAATAIDVLANDVPKTVTKTVGSTTDPGRGTVQITDSHTTVSYEPEPDFCGTDSFDYTLTPGDLSATVTVTVSCVNDAPVAKDDTLSTDGNVALELPASGAESLAANDSDADGDPLTVTAASDAVGGTVEVVGGLVRFTPSQDECGVAGGFDYTVSDSQGAVDQGHVTVDVACTADIPDLVLDDVLLPSTSFGTLLRAKSNSQGEITYSVLSGDTERVAEVSPGGELLVKGPGTLTVQASQAAYASYAKRQVTATVTIEDGRPGAVITSAPTHILVPGETFEIRYRVNFVAKQSDVTGAFGDDNFLGLDHTPPARVGEEGVFKLQVRSTAQSRQSLFTLLNVGSDTFSGVIENEGFSNPDLNRAITVYAKTQNEIQGLNLGPPITLTYDPSQSVQMPQILDATGAVWPWKCPHWLSSNTDVLREQPIVGDQESNDWRTTGVGETTVQCDDPGAEGIRSVQVTVQGADPQIQGFPAIEIGMDSSPLTLLAPASLNASGAWSYSIINSDENPVAEIVDGQVVPRAAGTVTIRATQAAADNYREASIEAQLTVDPASARRFADIVATYLDPDFTVPRPDDAPDGVDISYTIEDSKVAEIVDGRIHINGASEIGTTITAHWQDGGADQERTGKLTVHKARPRLMFSFPKRLYGISACGADWIWPVANQGTNNNVGGTLITNSDGALYYPMGVDPGGLPGVHPYYLRSMGTNAYTKEMAVWETAWVEQRESANFLPAKSEILYYALYANDNVIWSEVMQDWFTSCDM